MSFVSDCIDTAILPLSAPAIRNNPLRRRELRRRALVIATSILLIVGVGAMLVSGPVSAEPQATQVAAQEKTEPVAVTVPDSKSAPAVAPARKVRVIPLWKTAGDTQGL